MRYADVGGLVPQGISAELIADKWGLSREDLDAFGARSQQLAEQAHERGPLRRRDHPGGREAARQGDAQGHRVGEIVKADEGIRPGTTVETLAS